MWNTNFRIIEIVLTIEKSRIWETQNLSMCADSSTHTKKSKRLTERKINKGEVENTILNTKGKTVLLLVSVFF